MNRKIVGILAIIVILLILTGLVLPTIISSLMPLELIIALSMATMMSAAFLISQIYKKYIGV